MTVPDVSLSGIEFVIKGSSDGASSSVDKLSGRLNKLLNALDKIGKATKKAFTFPITQAAGRVSKFAKSLSGVVSSFKRILGYRMIRSVIRQITQGFSEGIKNLYGWSNLVNGKFAASMDSITTSMSYFKNSIAAAVAPIVNALAPAIDFLVDKVVTLINVINQLFALLTGAGSWTRATRRAEEYGDAVGGAGSAAKEAMKYLAPFDELNRLPDNNGGGGGGGSSTDYSGMFEQVTEFTSGISDFASAIREAIANGNWEGLGVILGQKINEIVDSVPWGTLGTWVGEKINALFTTEYWTLKTINFQNIGAKVAEFFNNALAAIDFSNVGGIIAQKLTILPSLFIGAINNLNFSTVGKSIGDTVKGFFSNIADWAMGVDWSGFASNLVSGLIDLLAELDVVGIVTEGLKVATSVVLGITDGLYGVLDSIYETVKEYFSSGTFWSNLKNAFAQKWNDFANWANQFLPDKLKLPTAEIDVDTNPTLTNDGWNQWKQSVQNKGSNDPPSVSAKAKFDQFLNNLTNNNTPTLGARASFNQYSDGFGTKPALWASANFNSFTNTLTSSNNKKPSLGANANLNAYTTTLTSGNNKKPVLESTANINAKTIAKSLLNKDGLVNLGNATAKVTAVVAKPGLTIDVTGRVTRTTRANGGVYTNGGWRPITSYASGGSPYGGQIFRARENGNPELVGTLKGSTAVMNNDQIVSSVAAGVARSIAGIHFQLTGLGASAPVNPDEGANEETIYRAFRRALDETDFGGDINLDGNTLYKAMVSRNKKEIFRTGVNPMMSRA